MNRAIVLAIFCCAVAACGVETASTAATAAALKQKELEAGRKTLEKAEKDIGQSMNQVQQGAAKAAEADK